MKGSTILYIIAGIVLVAFAGFLIYWRAFEVATGVVLYPN
jgi:flagellar basal body-associated protein FliL